MTMFEMAQKHTGDMYTARNALLYDAKQAFNNAERAMFGDHFIPYQSANETQMVKELRHMLTTSHEWVDASTPGTLSDVFKKLDVVRDFVDRKDPAHFVYVYNRRGVQMFNVMEIIPNQGGVMYGVDAEATSKTYTADTLPEHIMGQIATLNILEEDGYVDEVGLNIGDGMFIVL
jgi:hypothetical protein